MFTERMKRMQAYVYMSDNIHHQLMCLEYGLLKSPQRCDKCNDKWIDWAIIRPCNHTICSNCLDFSNRRQLLSCPKCHCKFVVGLSSASVEQLKRSYLMMEELLCMFLEIEKSEVYEFYMKP